MKGGLVMRRDIAKVVFERPKGNRTWASKTPRPASVTLTSDGEQFDENANHVHRKRQKRRNSNVSPLEHFLACRIGRPWDRVWSEVCEAADMRSSLGGEIREHIDRLVATACWIESRVIMTTCCGTPRPVRGFYVHPRSGLLQRTREDR